MASSSRVQPPWDFQCPYRDCCPHLQWSSTQWIWSEYERSYDEHREHWRARDDQTQELQQALAHIRTLETENAQLKAKLKALHQRQFKTNRKPRPQESDKSQHHTGSRKRGAPKGHPGWYRDKPNHVDKTIVVAAPEICPHCSCNDLTPIEELKDHLQQDIVLQPQTRVTNFKHRQAFCPRCNRPIIQAADGELLNCHIGPTTKAAAVFLRYGLGLPYRKVKQLFDVFFNMPFVPASAMAFDRQATKKGEPLYEDLKDKLRASVVAHADETSWRQDGIGHHLWYGGNRRLAFFHIDRHRSKEVAQNIFGQKFDGVLIADGYAAYNGVNPEARQSCLAHLIRKAKEIKQEIMLRQEQFHDPQAIEFCDQIVALFKQSCKIAKKVHSSDLQWQKAVKFKRQLRRKLKAICKKPLSDTAAEGLRQRLCDPAREYDLLFTFLDYPDVEPTNNQAEQSLRPLVIFRKVCFGTRSPAGSHSHSVLPSLLLTAKRQANHPLTFLRTLFLSDTATTQAALYNDSS